MGSGSVTSFLVGSSLEKVSSGSVGLKVIHLDWLGLAPPRPEIAPPGLATPK